MWGDSAKQMPCLQESPCAWVNASFPWCIGHYTSGLGMLGFTQPFQKFRQKAHVFASLMMCQNPMFQTLSRCISMWLFSDQERHANFQPWRLNCCKIQIIVYSAVYNTTTIMFKSNRPNVQLCYSKCPVTKVFYEQFFGVCLSRAYLTDFSLPYLYVPLLLPRRIILDRDTLFISSVTLEDQGVYMCVASTSLDSVTAESQLIVLGKRIFSWCVNSSMQYIMPLQHFCLFVSFAQFSYRASITQFHGRAMYLSLVNLSCAMLVSPGMGMLTQTFHVYLIFAIPKTRQPFFSVQESPTVAVGACPGWKV